MLSVSDCSVTLSNRLILQHIDIQFLNSEFTAIVGRNGSGKTTLVKTLTGEISCSQGNISINGANINNLGAKELACQRSVVPQFNHTAFPFYCSEIVAMGIDCHAHISKEQQQLIVNHTMQLMGVNHLAHTPFDKISGGEQQRIACARALAQINILEENLNGRTIILDEPNSSLDLRHEMMLFELLIDIAARGATVIVVLHNLNLALRYAHKVVLLGDGNVVDQGNPEDVLCAKNIKHQYSVHSETMISASGYRQLFVTNPIKAK